MCSPSVRLVVTIWMLMVLALQAQAQPALTDSNSDELAECRQSLDIAWQEMEATKQELESRNALLRRLKAALLSQREQAALLQASESEAREELEQLRTELSETKSAPLDKVAQKKVSSMERQVKRLSTSLKEEEALVNQLRKQTESLEDRMSKAASILAKTEKRALKAEERFAEVENVHKADLLVLKEKDKEIKDLRRALKERDELLSKRGRPSEPKEVTSTTPVKEPVDENQRRQALKWIVEGNRAIRDGEIEKAEPLFQKALEVDPELVRARLGIAQCRYLQNEMDEASAIVNAVLSEDGDNPQGLGLAGLISWQRGELKKADRYLSRAVKLEPNDAQLQGYSGVVLYAQNRRPEAIRALRQAVKLDPGHAEALFNLSVLLATDASPRIEEAVGYYEKALSLGSERDEKLEVILYP